MFNFHIYFKYLFKVVSKLTPTVMADIDRILGNKPIIRSSTKSEIKFSNTNSITTTTAIIIIVFFL